MVLIVAGLYCYPWGKRKETPSLTQPNVGAAGEVSTSMTAESTGVQSIAIVVSGSSPYGTVLEVEKLT